ncbi:mucin-3A-like [Spheniscus humboldti]
MGGRLRGSLAMVCICFLVIVRDDADQHAPRDKEQPDRQSSSSAKTWHWTPRAPEGKLNSRGEGPPAATSRRNPLVPDEKQGHTRMRRAAVFPKDGGTWEEELGTVYLPEIRKARDEGTRGPRRASEETAILEERDMSWSLNSWTPEDMDLSGKTDVSEDTLAVHDALDIRRRRSSNDNMSSFPSSIVTTWTSGNTEVPVNPSSSSSPSSSSTTSGTTIPTTMTTTLATTTIPTTTTNSTTSPTTMTSTPTTVPTTMTTLTTSTTTTTTSNPGQCQNGATWDGTKCVCPDGYYGIHCEMAICQNGGTWVDGLCQCTENFQGFECQFAKEIIEVKDVTVNATVEMKTKVYNRNFTDELEDKSSAAFKDFEKEFKEQMRELYKHMESYQDVVINKLTQGSIVVNYTVLLKVLASVTANETVESISKNLVSSFSNYTACNESCQGNNCPFCFNTAFTNVTNYKVQEVETRLCDSYIPEDFKSYYSPLVTATGVVCITRCDKQSADPYPCVHGTCVVPRSGPQCECSEQSAFWYQDSACSSRVSKVGVAVAVPVAGLVVAIVIFTAFLVRAQRQKEEYRQVHCRGVRVGSHGDRAWFSPVSVPSHRDKLISRSEPYCSTEEIWTGSQGFAASNQGATWEATETPSTAYINLESMHTSQKINIQRPSHIVIP